MLNLCSFVKKAATEAIMADRNQYTRPGGDPELIETLEHIYSPLFQRKLDGMSEIVTFNGAQEGIFAIMASLLDEVMFILNQTRFFSGLIFHRHWRIGGRNGHCGALL